MSTSDSSFNSTETTFTDNLVVHGGVMYLFHSLFIGSFLQNSGTVGGVIFVFKGSSVTIITILDHCIFSVAT